MLTSLPLIRQLPVMQYLYYLCQIGVSISPLSNNSLFLDYTKNPFPDFFAAGMNLALSTGSAMCSPVPLMHSSWVLASCR